VSNITGSSQIQHPTFLAKLVLWITNPSSTLHFLPDAARDRDVLIAGFSGALLYIALLMAPAMQQPLGAFNFGLNPICRFGTISLLCPLSAEREDHLSSPAVPSLNSPVGSEIAFERCTVP
jgi:hypothetical protein